MKSEKTTTVRVLVWGVLCLLSGCENGEPNSGLTTVEIKLGDQRVNVELAISDDEKEKGLMYRSTMEKNSGMLFVYEDEYEMCVWMKNTKFPLAVAFINRDGEIINTHEMNVESTDDYCSAKPAMYVLEMEKGWFSRNNVVIGSKIDLSKTPTKA